MMYFEPIELVWSGPFKFRKFIIEAPDQLTDFRCAGVYLWVEKGPAGERLTYIVRATGKLSLVQRQQDHYANYIGGRYNIPKEYREDGVEWVPNRYPDNSSVVLNVKRFIKLIQEAFEYTDKIEIYLAALRELNANTIRIIERNLLYDLSPVGTVPGTRSKPKDRVRIIHKNAGWYSESIKRFIRNQPSIV